MFEDTRLSVEALDDPPGIEIVDQVEIPLPLTSRQASDEIQVLHVDDSPDICELTKALLEDADDKISVTTETNVVTAFERLQDKNFDCIVSDYDMPNTNGLEFLEIVREQYPDLPFILLTGKGSEEIASEPISAGVTDYMQKSSEAEQYEILANRVRNAADNYRTQERFWDALSWYQRLVEQSFAGVFVAREGDLVYVNERLTEMLGYGRDELLDSPAERVACDSEDEATVREFVSVDADDRTVSQCTFTAECRDGTTLPVGVHGGAISYDDEPGYLGIVWDRSE